MTATPRPNVAEALEAAGWTADNQPHAQRCEHPSGAALVFHGDTDNCALYFPPVLGKARRYVLFTYDIPDAVVIAACLAASGQLDPVQAREDSTWLGWLEAAGVDNWQGMGVAQDMREEYERKQLADDPA